MQNHYRAIFISDFHMGAKTFNAPLLLDFLKKHDCDILYLVGDIIDGWKLHKRWYWPDIYTHVLDEILRKKENGTKIFYVTGNHDEALRHLNIRARRKLNKEHNFTLVNEMLHQAKDGKKYVVTHGDQFDGKILQGNLSKISDRFYAVISDILHRQGPYVQIRGKMKRFSLAKAVNTTGHWALGLLSNFERLACAYARRLHADGIICGHTHVAGLMTIDKMIYANSGGWLRHLHTALVETDTGALDLLEWSGESIDPDTLCAKPFSDKALRFVKFISETWPVQEKSKIKSPKKTSGPHYPGAIPLIRLYKKILAT